MDAMEYQVDGLTVVDEGRDGTRDELIECLIIEMKILRDSAQIAWRDQEMEGKKRARMIGEFIAQLLEVNAILERMMNVRVLNERGAAHWRGLIDEMFEWQAQAERM